MKRGFSLVELSIVLVILGLLVGGVLSGQALIKAAELRSISTDFQKYYAATQSFRDKYFALPGDITNATAFWGISAGATGNDATCGDSLSTGVATCNGDGDGNFSTIGSTSTYENHRYWQHMANAGLIEGKFTGTGTFPASRITGSYPGINAPILRIARTTFQIMNLTRNAGMAADYFEASFTYGYYFGTVTCTTGCGPNEAALTPEEAWNIDTKMDDGKPSYGKVQTYRRGGPGIPASSQNCATTAVTATAAYDLATNTKLCALQLGF